MNGNGFVKCPNCRKSFNAKYIGKHIKSGCSVIRKNRIEAILEQIVAKIVTCPDCGKEMGEDYLNNHRYVIHNVDYRRKNYTTTTMAEIMFDGTTPIYKLSWIILESDIETSFAKIMRYYEHLKRVNPHMEYDLSRLHKVKSLNPSEIYIGLDEFDGYIVFHFSKLGKAVLECPVVGNAVYVLTGDWMGLSKLSKTELLHHHNRAVKRVIHTDDWFNKLKSSLRRV